MGLKERGRSEQDIDERLTETFPASDPPSCTQGRDPGKSFMKAMRICDYGGPEQLRYENVPVPQVSRTDILIKVCGSSVNPIDCKLASGALRPVMNNKAVTLPWIPGCDFSGIIENIGEDILGFKKGDEVYGNCPAGGAYAQFVIAQPDCVAIKPQKLDFMEAAVVPVAGLTAWQALFDHGHLEKGQTVLIHGGSGGVGTFAIQLALWKNARVLATGGSTVHMDYLHELGVNEAIDYKSNSFDSYTKKIDLVLDLIGGETQENSFNLIKEGGRIVSTVSLPSQEAGRQHKVYAIMMTMKPSTEQLKRLSELLIEKSIKTHILKVYPLTQAKEAWSEILTHHAKGKIVLKVC